MQEKILRFITLSGTFFGIVMLYLYSLHVEPIEMPIADVGEHEGDLVIIQGVVIDVHRGNSGMSFVLRQDNATVGAYLESGSSCGSENSDPISPGDVIRVMGMVSSYNGGYSITISGWNMLEIIERWDRTILTLPMLGLDPWNHIGLNVNISCRIGTDLEVKDGYSRCYVQDRDLPDYCLSVLVFDRKIQRYPPGTCIFLNARLEYKQETFSFKCIIDSQEHGIYEDSYGEFFS